MQMVIRHGEKVMCTVEDEQGQPRQLTVTDFIRFSLDEDDISLRTPIYARILDEAVEHGGEEGFRADRYFENHPDIEIARIANELAHDNETLSKIHSRVKTIETEEERLVDLVPHLMTDYKLAIIEERISSLMQQLRSLEAMADRNRLQEVMQAIGEAKAAQKELARRCGDRVLMK